MCFSSRATPPLGIDSLHHGTVDSRPPVDALQSLSHCRRLEGACRVRADCELTASHPPLFSPSRHALCHWAECDRPVVPTAEGSGHLAGRANVVGPQCSTTIVGLRHPFHWACPLVRHARLIAILRIMTDSTVAESKSRRLVQKQTPTRRRRNIGDGMRDGERVYSWGIR